MRKSKTISSVIMWGLGLLIGGSLVFGCAMGAAGSGGQAKAGSMARFIVKGGYLYALNQSELLVYEIEGSRTLQRISTTMTNAMAETLFSYGSLLFVGTRQGMLIYSLDDPEDPAFVGSAEHIYSCDPVVVQSDIAFVTTRSGSQCRGGNNELLIFDVSDPTKPLPLAALPLPNPHGLAVDGPILFIADMSEGLHVIDVENPEKPRLLATLPIESYDLVADDGMLYVSGTDGLFQLRYQVDEQVQVGKLSQIPIQRPVVER